MTTHGKRAVLLARQSLKKSPDSVSIAEQIESMKRYCADKGYVIVGIIQSENVRGTRERDQRADLTEIEALADDGQFDVLVVFKMDRLARYLRVQENVIYELERHQVSLESATEPIVNSVMGRQVLGMMAEQFSRDLSQRLTGVVAAHVRMGKHMGKAPLGYYRGDDDHLHINPDTSPAARDLFRWRMDGMGSPAIKTRLLDTYGRTLSEFSILRILGNPVYIGAVTGPNDLIVHNAHEPLIDRATWDAVQRSLAHRRAVKAKRESSYLEGLITCGCGRPMYLVRNTTNWQGKCFVNWKFRCRSTLGHGAHPCEQAVHSKSKRKVEAAVLAQLQDRMSFIAGQNVAALVAAAEANRSRRFPGWQRRQADLTAKLTKARQRQEAINEARLDGRMTRDEANRRYRALALEIAQAEAELAAGPPPVDPAQIDVLRFVATQLLGAGISELAATAPQELHVFLKQVGARVVLRDGVPVLEGV
jgi:DNA invertase Pin-like site-specific DNA recombinase